VGVVDDRRPVAVFGCPLYNHAEHVESAIGSLLSQTRRDFVVLLLDDGSDDATAELAARIAERDERVHFSANPERLGLARSWRAVFEWARRDWPDARYFAWGSDHDLWEPAWLDELVAALERHPDAVLAYPITERMEADGTPHKLTGEFDTRELTERGAPISVNTGFEGRSRKTVYQHEKFEVVNYGCTCKRYTGPEQLPTYIP